MVETSSAACKAGMAVWGAARGPSLKMKGRLIFMKKRFWTRLVSAALTVSLLVSVLVLPAEAASENWAVLATDGTTGNDVHVFVWWTPKYEEEMADKETLKDNGYIVVENIPEEAYIGISTRYDEPDIYWYGKDFLEHGDAGVLSLDMKTGRLEFTDGAVLYPINPPENPNDGANGSSAVAGNAGMVIAAAGAAAVAATGVYFYTHPEKWQEVKDYVADLSANVQAKFQEFTDGVKGALGIPTEEAETAETAENAENAAVPQDAAA